MRGATNAPDVGELAEVLGSGARNMPGDGKLPPPESHDAVVYAPKTKPSREDIRVKLGPFRSQNRWKHRGVSPSVKESYKRKHCVLSPNSSLKTKDGSLL